MSIETPEKQPRTNLPPQLKQDIERVDAVIANTDGPREYHITMQQSLSRIIDALVRAQAPKPDIDDLKVAAGGPEPKDASNE